MQALNGLVIGMAILIVAGMALLVYGVVRKASDPGFTLFAPTAAPEGIAARPAPVRFGEATIALAPGCEVVEMRPDGDRLYLRVGPPGGACERVLVIDATQGTLVGTIAVKR